jgi:hypothetical protein
MRILPSKNKRTKKILAFGLIIAILLAVVALAFYKIGPFSSKDASDSTSEERNTGTDIKKQSVDQTSKGQHSGSDPSPEPQPIPGSNKSSVNADITSTNQDQTSLHIRALIQTVTSSGTCTLTMTGPNGKSYTATVPVQALPSTSTCRGFDIPLTQLSTGSWNIKVDFNNDTLTASASKDTTIQ